MKSEKSTQKIDRIKKKLGQKAEKLAAKLAKKKGVKILTKNFETDQGEIDFIGKKDDLIIFFEVRSRTEPYFIDPAQSVNNVKQRKIAQTAKDFILKHRINQQSYRFDIVTVVFAEDFSVKEMNHIENAFTPRDLRGF